jgi:segregation and condensation protein A
MLIQPLPTINLPDFEGPLDLLLHLIREHKVDITDIPIEPIADQYIAYINSMEERDLAVAGEFFLMAATLLEIKTRMLLPKPDPPLSEDDLEDPRQQLVERLQEYERFKALAQTLHVFEEARGELFVRDQADYAGLYELPIKFGQLDADALLRALVNLLEDVDDGQDSITSVRRQKTSLKLAIRLLLARVKEGGSAGIDFASAFVGASSRIDIIMTFLAMLELLRQGKIEAVQDALLGPICLRCLAQSL